MKNAQTVEPSTEPGPPGAPEDVQALLTDIREGWSAVSALPAGFQTLQTETAGLRQQLTEVRRHMAVNVSRGRRARGPGMGSEECARHWEAELILRCGRRHKRSALGAVAAPR